MPFIPAFKPLSTDSNRALWFIFHEDRLLIKANEDTDLIPHSRDLAKHDIAPIQKQYLGSLDGLPWAKQSQI